MNRLQLKAWRRDRWVTQAQLSTLLDVDKATVYRWESGNSDLPPYLKLALDQLDALHYWNPEGIDALPRIGRKASVS